jgi:DNA-binding transcriptional LysR family regulator
MQNLHGVTAVDFVWFKDLGNLARTGNFSQAAELGHISQPAFSRRIKALEDWVGSSLVDRSKHPVSLTAAGLQMLEAGQQALARIEYERAQILEAQTRPDKYVITFGAQHSIGWRFYPAWLHAFESAYGPIMSRLRADDLPSCVEALRAGEVDFVIAYESRYAKGISGIRSLDSLTIGDDALIPLCKAGPGGEPLFVFGDPEAPPIPYLRFGPAAPITQHVDPLLERAGLHIRLSVVYENAMVGALRIRARDGAGVAWLPRSLVAPDLAAGVLAITGEPGWQIPLHIRLYRLQDQTNQLTRNIWAFLSVREQVPLVARV